MDVADRFVGLWVVLVKNHVGPKLYHQKQLGLGHHLNLVTKKEGKWDNENFSKKDPNLFL